MGPQGQALGCQRPPSSQAEGPPLPQPSAISDRLGVQVSRMHRGACRRAHWLTRAPTSSTRTTPTTPPAPSRPLLLSRRGPSRPCIPMMRSIIRVHRARPPWAGPQSAPPALVPVWYLNMPKDEARRSIQRPVPPRKTKGGTEVPVSANTVKRYAPANVKADNRVFTGLCRGHQQWPSCWASFRRFAATRTCGVHSSPAPAPTLVPVGAVVGPVAVRGVDLPTDILHTVYPRRECPGRECATCLGGSIPDLQEARGL